MSLKRYANAAAVALLLLFLWSGLKGLLMFMLGMASMFITLKYWKPQLAGVLDGVMSDVRGKKEKKS